MVKGQIECKENGKGALESSQEAQLAVAGEVSSVPPLYRAKPDTTPPNKPYFRVLFLSRAESSLRPLLTGFEK